MFCEQCIVQNEHICPNSKENIKENLKEAPKEIKKLLNNTIVYCINND